MRWSRSCGEDTVAVMDEEAIGMVRGKGFTQLLQRPLRRGRRGHIDVQQSAARVLDNHEHIEETKSRRDATQKSQATIACAWLRTNVDQRCDVTRVPGPRSRRFGMYMRTVRGERAGPASATVRWQCAPGPRSGCHRPSGG